MNRNKQVLIVGAGAIGAFYGALLAKSGCEVSVVCRSDYPVVKQHGFQIDSHELGQWRFTPKQVLTRAADYSGQADYVILTSKITRETDRIALIRDAVSPKTVIVFIQNGVDIEQELVDAFPNNEIVSGLAFICCNRLTPGQITHLAYGKLTLGNVPHGVSAKTHFLIDCFQQAGIECIGMDDIITGRWIKCIWNAPFNPLSVLSGGLATLDILTRQEDFIRRIMQEVFDIAAACGHPLPDDVIDTNIKHTYNMPPYKTSMLLDFENNRPLETEVILGNAIRAAKLHHLACPNLEALYALMQLREWARRLSDYG
jgi:2-dehydropantoate 2-reductase